MASLPSRLPDPVSEQPWPPLPFAEWEATRATLHMWTQIVGKIRTRLAPPQNHYWHCTLYVTPRGLTTSAIPFGNELFEIEFDFAGHELLIRTSRGLNRAVKLYSRSVADFYRELLARLRECGIEAKIWTMPQEVPDPIPFDRDEQHHSYDPEHARRFWRVLASCDQVFREFAGEFLGKQSPVHFFWGSFDLAVTRFSGRRAPERPGADPITREAYSHEVVSIGWWPGGGDVKDAAFYAYAAPEPAGFRDRGAPRAFYQPSMGEYLMMYEQARDSGDPRRAVLDFAHGIYDSAATLGGWDPDLLRRPLR